jgi:hypothetical protein
MFGRKSARPSGKPDPSDKSQQDAPEVLKGLTENRHLYADIQPRLLAWRPPQRRWAKGPAYFDDAFNTFSRLSPSPFDGCETFTLDLGAISSSADFRWPVLDEEVINLLIHVSAITCRLNGWHLLVRNILILPLPGRDDLPIGPFLRDDPPIHIFFPSLDRITLDPRFRRGLTDLLPTPDGLRIDYARPPIDWSAPAARDGPSEREIPTVPGPFDGTDFPGAAFLKAFCESAVRGIDAFYAPAAIFSMTCDRSLADWAPLARNLAAGGLESAYGPEAIAGAHAVLFGNAFECGIVDWHWADVPGGLYAVVLHGVFAAGDIVGFDRSLLIARARDGGAILSDQIHVRHPGNFRDEASGRIVGA